MSVCLDVCRGHRERASEAIKKINSVGNGHIENP